MGNALWTGVRLRDVLQAAGIETGATHVAFTGLDRCTEEGEVIPFGGSIPLVIAAPLLGLLLNLDPTATGLGVSHSTALMFTYQAVALSGSDA